MKTDKTSLLEQISILESTNLNLQSEISFLKGKIEAYERFLKRQGFIKDDVDDINDTNIVNVPFVNRRTDPINDGWVCPQCGKRVGSMEVH